MKNFLFTTLYLWILWLDPLEEETKSNVVAVSRKLPVEALAVPVRRYAYCHGLSMPNLEKTAKYKEIDIWVENERQQVRERRGLKVHSET